MGNAEIVNWYAFPFSLCLNKLTTIGPNLARIKHFKAPLFSAGEAGKGSLTLPLKSTGLKGSCQLDGAYVNRFPMRGSSC